MNDQQEAFQRANRKILFPAVFDSFAENGSYSYKRVFHHADLFIVTGILAPLALFGIVANCLTIYVICWSKKLKSVFNFFILSLSISDLMSSFLSPCNVYRNGRGFEYWEAPTFLCKVFWGGDNGTSVLTSLHVLVFSALRFASLKWPHQFHRFNKQAAKITILILWMIAVTCGFVPFAIWSDAFFVDRERFVFAAAIPSCTIGHQHIKSFKYYSIFGYSLFFFLPCLSVFIFSTAASILLLCRRNKRKKGINANRTSESERRRQRKENQAILQLIMIVGSFLLGYLPVCAYFILAARLDRRSAYDHRMGWWLSMGSFISLRASECLNPIFYNLASSKMRKETQKVLRRMVAVVRRSDSDPTTRSDSDAIQMNNMKTVSTHVAERQNTSDK